MLCLQGRCGARQSQVLQLLLLLEAASARCTACSTQTWSIVHRCPLRLSPPEALAPAAHMGRSLTIHPCLPSLAARRSALRNCCLFFTIPEAVNLSLYALAVGLGAGAVHPTTPVAVQLVATYARVFLASATLATFAHRRRGEVRRLEGIPGAAWKDWCLYFWFPGCAVSRGCTLQSSRVFGCSQCMRVSMVVQGEKGHPNVRTKACSSRCIVWLCYLITA